MPSSIRLPPPRRPFEKEDVVLIDRGPDVPGRLRHLAQELGERLADAVPAALHACRGDEDGVVAVVGDDLVEILGAQRLCVVAEDLLGAARRCHATASLPLAVTDLLISAEDKTAHKDRVFAPGPDLPRPSVPTVSG
jgi:hypothetical protein